MLYGDRIIHGILSLIYLEPCQSPTIPLGRKRRRAHRALTEPGWHSFLGFHIYPFKMFFSPFKNEMVPDFDFPRSEPL